MDLVSITRWRILIPAVTLIIGLYSYGCSLVFAGHSPSLRTEPIFLPESIQEVIAVSEERVKTVDVTHYKAFSMPGEDGSYEAYRPLFEEVAAATGVDIEILAYFAAMESSFRAKVDAPVGTAKGLFQFTEDTWEFAVKRHGERFGISVDDCPTDPRAAALIAALSIEDNRRLIEKHFPHQEIGMTELYLAHFLGRTGVLKFMKANPGKIAAKQMPRQAKANPNIFYHKKQALTYKEIRITIEARQKKVAEEFGIV